MTDPLPAPGPRPPAADSLPLVQLLAFITWRFLTYRWRQSLVSVATVALGVAVLLTALSLTNGFEEDLVNKILGTSPHLSLSPVFSTPFTGYQEVQRQVQGLPHVRVVTPSISGQALVVSGPRALGTLVQGIDPRQENEAGVWHRYLKEGHLPANASPSLVVGSELARRLDVRVGDSVQVVTGMGNAYPFVVTGLFQAGLYEFDSHICYLSLTQASRLYSLPAGAIHSLTVRLDEPLQAPAVAQAIQKRYPLLTIRSWLDKNHSLLAAMALEKKVIFLVMSFIIVVALFGMANVLAMVALEKAQEISILRAIGATSGHIATIFLLQGLLIGLTGLGFGCAGGLAASALLQRHPLNLPGDIYYIDKLPVRMEGMDFVGVSMTTLGVCLIAAILPIRRAIRLDPIEVIRRFYGH